MDKSQLQEFIKSIKPDAEIKDGNSYPEITVKASELFDLAKKLKEHESASFDFLVNLTGIDYGKDLGVTYHLESTRHKHMIVIKTRTEGRENPVIDSVCSLWQTAEFLEREVYDLLGVRFNNHPDLRRLFLDSSWGYPLRKDYVDDVNIVSK